MNKLLKVLTLSLLVMALVIGCSGGETPKTPEKLLKRIIRLLRTSSRNC